MSEGFNEKTKEVKSIGDSILDYEIFEFRALKEAEVASAGKDTAFSKKITMIKERAEGIKNEESEGYEKEYSRWEAADFQELLRKLKKEGILDDGK